MNKCQFYCNYISSRARSSAGGGGGLPAEYQQVEYIETGQYGGIILTGINTITNNSSFEFEFLNTSGDIVTALRKDGFGLYFGYYNDGYYQYGSGGSTISAIPRDTKVKYKTDRNSIYRYNYETGQYTLEKTVNISNFSMSQPLPICGENYNGVIPGFGAMHGRIYSYKFWEGTELMSDLIPCYRKADSVVGVFNLISQQFITAYYGDFTAGPEI